MKEELRNVCLSVMLMLQHTYTHAHAAIARNWRNGVASVVGSFAVYARQSVMLAMLAISLLGCSVLTLGFLMTSYLHWGGLTEAEVSACVLY